MQDLFQIRVDHVDRTERGFICQVVEYGNPDYTRRFVTNGELLDHLGADNGVIESMSESWNYAKDDVDQTYEYLTLDQWCDLNAGTPLEIELSLIINKAEGRMIAAPLPDGLDALNPILKLNKTAA